MKFKYKAQKADGEVYEGEREAPDKFVLYNDFKKEGGILLSAKEIKKSKKWDFKHLVDRIFYGSVSMHDKIIFAKNLGAMIEAGLPLSRALVVLEKQIRSKRLRAVINEIGELVKTGHSLSGAMTEFPNIFSSLFISVVKSGEESGKLAASLAAIAGQLDRTFYIERKVRGALLYPAVIVMLIIVVGAVMLVYVVPKLTAAFSDLKITLPLSTRVVIFVSDFLKNHYIVSLIILIVSVASLYLFAKTEKGKRTFDFIFLKIPIVGLLVKETNSARAARTLSSLLSSGVDVVLALGITGEVVQNFYYRKVLKKAAENIQKGVPLSAAFVENEKLYPAFFGEMISAGEETGNISGMLKDVGIFYENEIDQKTKDFSSVIEPLIMIVLGAAVGFFALAMISPLYSMTSSF